MFRVWSYVGLAGLSYEGDFEEEWEANNKLYECCHDYLRGFERIEKEEQEEIFYNSSIIEEV